MKPIEIIKIAFNLAVVYVIGGLLIAVIYAYTSPVKFQKEKEEKEAALQTMMPEADQVEELGMWEPHHKHSEYYAARKCGEVKIEKVTDEKTGKSKEIKKCINGTDIGYIAESYGKGYSSYIHVFVSLGNDLLIKKVKILGHKETPGLGDEVEKDYFLDQFVGKTADDLVVVKTETDKNIQAITGATISTRAVAEDAVKNAVNMLKEKLGSGNSTSEVEK
ncbi:MAG: FMN-binding protein [Thermodesulfovibrionia bacterium]|nr:FMN-binding protein [Thermodesulfovibrionia bacterium]